MTLASTARLSLDELHVRVRTVSLKPLLSTLTTSDKKKLRSTPTHPVKSPWRLYTRSARSRPSHLFYRRRRCPRRSPGRFRFALSLLRPCSAGNDLAAVAASKTQNRSNRSIIKAVPPLVASLGRLAGCLYSAQSQFW